MALPLAGSSTYGPQARVNRLYNTNLDQELPRRQSAVLKRLVFAKIGRVHGLPSTIT